MQMIDVRCNKCRHTDHDSTVAIQVWSSGVVYQGLYSKVYLSQNWCSNLITGMVLTSPQQVIGKGIVWALLNKPCVRSMIKVGVHRDNKVITIWLPIQIWRQRGANNAPIFLTINFFYFQISQNKSIQLVIYRQFDCE